MLSPAVMFSLLSTGPGGVHHIALDVQCHESPAATHSTGLDSSSDSVYSVEGHALRHLTDNHICQGALSKGLATQTCALEADGLPNRHSQLHVLASNTACSLHSFGGRRTISTPGWAFDQVRPHIERTPPKPPTQITIPQHNISPHLAPVVCRPHTWRRSWSMSSAVAWAPRCCCTSPRCSATPSNGSGWYKASQISARIFVRSSCPSGRCAAAALQLRPM